MKNEKKEYLAPLLTVVSFKAERGYAESEPPFYGLGLGVENIHDGQEVWLVDNYSGSGWTDD